MRWKKAGLEPQKKNWAGWRTKSRFEKTISANRCLELGRHTVRLHWLRGHAGHAENERCDVLARTYAGRRDLPPDPGFSPEDA